jgi:putative transport protein
MSWLTATLRSYPEIAVFLSLGIGYWVGGKSYHGFSLGAVTATLLAAIAIGQLGITISVSTFSITRGERQHAAQAERAMRCSRR